jgi:hypothetical protein
VRNRKAVKRLIGFLLAKTTHLEWRNTYFGAKQVAVSTEFGFLEDHDPRSAQIVAFVFHPALWPPAKELPLALRLDHLHLLTLFRPGCESAKKNASAFAESITGQPKGRDA